MSERVLEGKRIFMVEDDSSNLAITVVILRQAGALVRFDAWGEDAITSVRAALPLDIVLLDLMYPGRVTGYNIFTKLRTLRDLDNVPIVAVTAADPFIEIKKVREHGFSGYIPKPIRMQTFPQQIAAILAGESVWLTE